MSASKNLVGNTNIARAISGAFVVVVGGTVGSSLYGDCIDDESSSVEQKRQHDDDNHLLGLRRALSSTTTTSMWSMWSMIHNNSHRNDNSLMISACEAQKEGIDTDPSYPDLSRFGSGSYLRRYLTPEVYASLKDKTTKNGVTLEDIIRSGISLPWGAKPPRGTGVYAGDEESYHVFSELLVPIIEDYHHYHYVADSNKQKTTQSAGTSSNSSSSNDNDNDNDRDNNNSIRSTIPSHPISTFVTAVSPAMVDLDNAPMFSRNKNNKTGVMLRRQFTNLNRNSVLEQKLDPTGDYILETRMRVARSIKGFPFSPVISRAQRRELEQLFQIMVDEDWNNAKEDDDNDDDADDDGFGKTYNNHGGLRGGNYLRVMDMTNEQHDDLIFRHILFHDPDETNISAGIGRDWPDARGIYLSSSNGDVNVNNNSRDNPDLMMWLNKEDHMRIVATSNGGDLLAVFARLTKALTQVEQSLHKRGHAFCVHPRYGFVNTSPENLGTALRASVFIKLYRLGQQPGFEDLLDRLRLESSSRFKDNDGKQSGARYTGIFDIANSERLGQSEVQLINTMINGVGRLIELEKRLEQGETVDLEEVR